MHYFWESIVQPLLDAAQPTAIVEIGVEEGKMTRLLLPYAHQRNIHIHSIDPIMGIPREEWQRQYPGTFSFHQGISLDVLPTIPEYDAVLIDGDHNWFTVYHELKLIEEHAKKIGHFPLVLLHDTEWPYARRDLYYDPERIPAEFRQPHGKGGLIPGSSSLEEVGWNRTYEHAQEEGGPRNGVLTAVEDFLSQTPFTLRFMQVPGLHGIGMCIDVQHKQKKEMDRILETIRASDNLTRHIHQLETTRIDENVRWEKYSKNLEKKYIEEIAQRITLEKSLGKLAEEYHAQEQQLKRMQQSKSWRWTRVLREAEQKIHGQSDPTLQ